MAYNNGMKKYNGMKMDHGMKKMDGMKQSGKEADKEMEGKGIDMGSMSDGRGMKKMDHGMKKMDHGMKKTGIYQDRENGMLKNHGMLKDLGMAQEEGMRGMRKMRGMYQENVVDVNVTKQEEKEDRQEMLSTLKDNPSAVGVQEKKYTGQPLEVQFTDPYGKKMSKRKIKDVIETESGGYHFPYKQSVITMDSDNPNTKKIRQAINRFEYPFGKGSQVEKKP